MKGSRGRRLHAQGKRVTWFMAMGGLKIRYARATYHTKGEEQRRRRRSVERKYALDSSAFLRREGTIIPKRTSTFLPSQMPNLRSQETLLPSYTAAKSLWNSQTDRSAMTELWSSFARLRFAPAESFHPYPHGKKRGDEGRKLLSTSPSTSHLVRLAPRYMGRRKECGWGPGY